jgi:hypothetical protein
VDDNHFSSKQKFLRETLTLTNQFFFGGENSPVYEKKSLQQHGQSNLLKMSQKK